MIYFRVGVILHFVYQKTNSNIKLLCHIRIYLVVYQMVQEMKYIKVLHVSTKHMA